MKSDQILEKLNNWYESSNVIIPNNIENKKELEFIMKSRKYSNDGILSGPYSIEAAKRCLEIGLNYSDFSCDGGIGYHTCYFFYGWCHSLKNIERAYNYYNEIESYLKKLNISKHSFEKYWIRSNTICDTKCQEIERDLITYTLSEHLKNQLNIVAKEINDGIKIII